MNLYLDYINQNSNSAGLRLSDKSIISPNRMKNPNVIVLQYYVYKDALQN